MIYNKSIEGFEKLLYRLRELEKKKVILAYKCHLDPHTLNKIFCKALVYIGNTTPRKIEEFMNFRGL